MLAAAERPLIVAGGGIINADAADLLVEFAELTDIPVIPTLMGWGTIPDDHPLMAGMVGLQTSHRYGNATMLESDFVLGIGNRWANRHTGGLDAYTRGPHVRARRHRADPDRPGVRARLRHRLRRRGGAASCSSRWPGSARRPGGCPTVRAWVEECRERKRDHAAPHPLRQRADQAAAGLRGDEPGVRPRTPATSPRSACRRSPARSSCTSTGRGTGSTRPGRPAGLDHAGRARRRASPTRTRPWWRCPATTTSSS